MSIAVFLKKNLNYIPFHLGELINKIPYEIRPGIGSIYRVRKQEIKSFDSSPVEDQRQFIFLRMKQVVEYSYINVPFYNDYYKQQNFNPSELNSFDDISRIPIINKSILQEYSLEKRSAVRSGRYLVNTGGSSGSPFGFYIEPSSIGHEWAHMHHIWGKLGYEPTDLKIAFGGRSDLRDVVEYDVVRNHFAIDIYADYQLVSKKLKKILSKTKIKYLHGYPTSIFDFALFCRDNDSELQNLLSNSLKGIFFGSEYPHDHYRSVIENIFKVKTISWYGHTERAILAYEKSEKFKYEPFGTYGFAEALKVNESFTQLIGTSFYNFASPLIRYNTSDEITDVESESGIMNSFKITKGREGEFIIDKNQKKINLTGLIFGRHHDIFNHTKFIQVKQKKVGEIEVHFVSNEISEQDAIKLFDQRNLDIDIVFVKRLEPFRTISGKINLLIK